MTITLLEPLRRRVAGLSGRSRSVGIFFLTSVGARALGIACQLVQVPLAMRALGGEAFGLWMTLTSIGNVITFADFGVGQGAQNKLAEAFASDRARQARELWDTTLVFFGGVGLLLAAIVVPIARSLDFTTLFNLSDPLVQREAGGAVAVTLLLFCLNFPFGLAQRLAYSRQKGWTHNLVLALGGVGSLVGVLVATRFEWRLPALIAAAQAPLLLGNAALLLWHLGQLGWTDLRRVRCDWSTMRELVGLGAYFGVQQVQLVMFVSLPQLIISTSLGAAAVTPYNLAQRLFNLFAVIQNGFMLPLWPAYSAAKARGEFGWIRRTLFLSLGATGLCTLVPMAVGTAFARPILAAWIGPTAALPSPALVWLLFCWNAALFLEQPFGYMLAGISELRRLTFYAIVSALLSASLMILLVQRYAQEGVVLGLLAGFMPFLLLGNIAETVRVFRHLPLSDSATPGLVVAQPATDAPR